MDSHHQPPESESGALLFELQGYTKWFRGLESNQLPPAYEADERPVLFPGIENDPPAGAAPAWSALRVRCIADLCHGGSKKVVLPRGLAPRTSAFAERRAELLHFGSFEKRAPCRCCPGAVSLEETRACCYTNDANENGGCVRYRAGLSSSSARR